MPTAAKLFAAVAFALVAVLAAEATASHLDEATPRGYLTLVAALVGAFGGWRIAGPAAGRGYALAAATGLRTVVGIVVVTLLCVAFYEMILRSLRRLYDGPMDALVGVVELAVDYAQYLRWPDVAGFLILGGMLAGLVAEVAARRWR